GIDDKHPDLQGNLWINRGEIPLNGIDDDGNGYVDDYRGWNVNLGNDNIDPEQSGANDFDDHGTLITGIIGARTNNGMGVAGMNWNIKVMSININTELVESDMIAAYAYVLDQRTQYNQTNGASGAYVVATNLSYGDEDLTPEDSPIWCGIYDSLGAQGIINVTATANRALNIDEIKDVPTSCSSDHMIAVTATNIRDERTFAAFGINDIDLAAPGSDIFSTTVQGYGDDRGASFAAPMIVGTVALLYASPCSDLASLAGIDPAAASLMARSLVLDNVDQIPTLADDVQTGGRLNTGKALRAIVEGCNACLAPAQVVIEPALDSAVVSFLIADSVSSVQLHWWADGDSTATVQDSVSSPFVLSDLSNCTPYNVQLISTCVNGQMDTTSTFEVTTMGCCLAPDSLEVELADTLCVTWQGHEAAQLYELWIRADQDTVWTSHLDSNTSIKLPDLLPCTAYRAQVRSLCQADTSAFSEPIQFLTLGCGTCLDSIYCLPPIAADNPDYIDSFSFHTLANRSGPDGGYGDFTGGPQTSLKQGSQYVLSVFPGSSEILTDRRYYAWIDYDQSGSFENESELVALSDSAMIDPYHKTLRIPPDAPLGSTRLRILSLMETSSDTLTACDAAVEFGEVEDYCVSIIFDSLLCPQTPLVDTILVTESSAEVIWERVDSSIAFTFRWREVGSDEWMDMSDTTNTFTISDLEECTEYEFQVNTVCAFDTSGYTESLVFTTTCLMTPTVDIAIEDNINVYPNPFQSEVLVDFREPLAGSVRVDLYDLQGRQVVRSQMHTAHAGVIKLQALDALPNGIYFLKILIDDRQRIHKLVKS
ncbi:MAG: S8 family serine peptidase, partial [Saprospiraceae bacterium]|nr:S8 family serine peptidase [Saprospiraceae bacterium]